MYRFLAFFLVFVPLAHAETEVPVAVSVSSFFYGPSLANPSTGEVPTTWQNQSTGLTVQNQLGARYQLAEDLTIMPVFDFELVMTDPAYEYKQDQYFSLTYDSFLKLARDNLANFELGPHSGWLNVDLRAFVPTSEYSRDNHTLGSLRFTVSPGLQLANSRFSVNFINFARYFLQTQTTVTNTPTVALPRLMFYTGPLVNYQASSQLALWLLAEASVTYDTKGTPNTRQRGRSLVDLEPGIDLRLGKGFTISPYLNWFVNQPLSTTSVNLTASLTI